uniref:Uncharacterized protein n=1 Tax=Nelumbo nucifera TaxID=4432 RepID=A0A822YN91_NELNU|nr:TPA_asm: hypothetical protein HUJ06_011336 [Nelumbo nucifera]
MWPTSRLAEISPYHFSPENVQARLVDCVCPFLATPAEVCAMLPFNKACALVLSHATIKLQLSPEQVIPVHHFTPFFGLEGSNSCLVGELWIVSTCQFIFILIKFFMIHQKKFSHATSSFPPICSILASEFFPFRYSSLRLSFIMKISPTFEWVNLLIPPSHSSSTFSSTFFLPSLQRLASMVVANQIG